MFENLALEKKLDLICELEKLDYLSNNEWDKILKLIDDSSAEVRLGVSELLALFPSSNSEKILLSMLNDSDYLVRASVCDSLSFSHSQETLRLLMTYAEDKNYLVRGYAILSIGDVQLNIKSDLSLAIDYLNILEKKEKSQWVKIAIFRSLFILGDFCYGEKLLDMIDSKYYKNRCFVLSLLEQILENNQYSNLLEIKTVIQKRLKIEKVQSVQLKLSNLLNICLEKTGRTVTQKTQGDGSSVL